MNSSMMTGAEFVRSRPLDMPTEQVMAEALAAGVTVTRNTVTQTRWQDKKRAELAKAQRELEREEKKKRQAKQLEKEEKQAVKQAAKQVKKKEPSPKGKTEGLGPVTELVLKFLKTYIAEHDEGPADSQVIADALKTKPKLAQQAVIRLRAAGYISHEPRRYSTIRLLGPALGKSAPSPAARSESKAGIMERVLTFIGDYIDKHGESPSRQVVSESLGLEVDDVSRKLNQLKRTNQIDYEHGDPRTIRILGEPPKSTSNGAVHHHVGVPQGAIAGLMAGAENREGLKLSLLKLSEELDTKAAAVRKVLSMLDG